MSNYGQLLYLNPELAQSNVYTAVQLSNYLQSYSSSDFRMVMNPDLLGVDPQIFFGLNAQSVVLNVLALDSAVRSSNPPASPGVGTYVPNLYVQSTVVGSNVLYCFTSNTAIETNHLSNQYYVRLAFADGTFAVTSVSNVNRSNPNLLVVTTNDDILINTNCDARLMNPILQGIFLQDATREMLMASAQYSGLNSNYDMADFNYGLYTLLYPQAANLSIEEAFLDYTTFNTLNTLPRIGTTSEIATVFSNLSAATYPVLSVNTLNVSTINLAGVPILGTSSDYITEWPGTDDAHIVTERAIKEYADRVRDAQFRNLYASNATFSSTSSTDVTSTMLTSTNVATSNVFACNVSAGQAEVENAFVQTSISCNLFASNAWITEATASNVSFSNASGNNIWSSNALFSQAVIGQLNASALITPSIWASNICTNQLVSTSASVCNATSGEAWTSNMTSSNMFAQQFTACNIVGASVSVNTLSGTSGSIANITACNVASSNVTASNVIVSLLTANTLYAGILESSNVTTQSSVASQLSASNAVIGRLDVQNIMTFPPSTFLSSSNLYAQSLIVDGPTQLNSVTSSNNVTHSSKCFYFSMGRFDPTESAIYTMKETSPDFASIINSCDVSMCNNVPVISGAAYTDRELLALCIGALQQLHRN